MAQDPGTNTPTITPTPTATHGPPPGPLPDLTVRGSVSVFGPGEGGCVRPGWDWWTDGAVTNSGDAAAGPFVVRSSSGIEWAIVGLAAGETEVLEKRRGMSTSLMADADEQVVESNEDNNRYMIPIPTLPLPCTPTPGIEVVARLYLPYAHRPNDAPARPTATGMATLHATATHEPGETTTPDLTHTPTPLPRSGETPEPTHTPTPTPAMTLTPSPTPLPPPLTPFR